MKGRDSIEDFYTCLLPWFGLKCQYRFNNELPLPFNDIVRKNFITRPATRKGIPAMLANTYYPFLTNCDRDLSLFCLDWCEIYDGRLDCTHGEDEQYCQILDMSECSNDAYRCH